MKTNISQKQVFHSYKMEIIIERNKLIIKELKAN